MVEMVSDVYDLICPSPLTLKEITSTAIGIELWRWELGKCNTNDAIDKLLLQQAIPFKSLVPGLPRTIYHVIEEHRRKFRSSIVEWLQYHTFEVFVDFHRLISNNYVIDDFNEFVCDYDGTINYVQTAKKMMLCDRFSKEEKFRIACLYCFEDDIRRIWPSVSGNYVDLDEIDFDVYPILYYWVRNLRNELHLIPNSDPDNFTIYHILFDKCPSNAWSSVIYFWNCVPLEYKLQETVYLINIGHKESFVRFILPKLNNQLLDRFVAERGHELMLELLMNNEYEVYVLPTWTYIRNNISERNFTCVIENILKTETNHHIVSDVLKDRPPEIVKRFSAVHQTTLCCKIWEYAPYNLKQSAIRNISGQSNETLFKKQRIMPSEPREVRFLLTVLLDATFDDRNSFWHKNWHHLIVNTRVCDLNRIMKICFKNESEITQFKANVMSEYDNISPYCIELLEDGFFEELDAFLSFCCSGTQTRKQLKRRLLQLNFLGEESILNVLHFGRVESMNEFINDAFDTLNLAMDFKNQLVSLPVTDHCLFECIRIGYFPCPLKFVNTFVSTERIVVQLKERFIESLREHLISGFVSNIRVVFLQEFLVWCLGNDDEADSFKDAISVVEVFHRMVEKERLRAEYRDGFTRYPLNLDEFLMWYFNTPEEIVEFKKRFSDVFKIFVRTESLPAIDYS